MPSQGSRCSNAEINSECRTLGYTGIVLTILGLVMATILHYRKSNSVEDTCSLMQ